VTTSFDPSSVETFRILEWSHDASTGKVELNYAFDDSHFFTETVTLPAVSADFSSDSHHQLQAALELLHLVAGVSYFKAAAPTKIVIEKCAVDSRVLELLRRIYGIGLGEFAYVNGISIPAPTFDVEQRSPKPETQPITQPGALAPLVAVGGGKDSCVSIEMMRSAGIEPLLASVNEPRAIRETIVASGFPSVHAGRAISPHLIELNAQGAYNGHVPVTAIVSMILTALAILNGRDAVVMSNERSASSGNLNYDGVEINHQYSKSLDFERLLSQVISTHLDGLGYFSLLRPFSELAIARRFSLTQRYDKSFTSCNRAFALDEARRIDHWCGDCPKCRFVFLCLAPHMSRKRLVAIFGKDMLDDPGQAQGFDELVAYNSNKPFECVGEVEESVAAFLLLADSDDWKGSRLVKRFANEVQPHLPIPADVAERPFKVSPDHLVPDAYVEVLNEIA
jgi:UDP-N-acetyl-alpha-D-muramoyl-L-alanyl-L-glutamate epimerase